MKKKESIFTTRSIVMVGVFAAILAVLSQVSIQTPWQIPVTLQTFAVALTGYVLGKWRGTLSVFVYILLGLAGVPVYAGFTAGLGKLAGVTGGYIIGFLFLAFGCGMYESIRYKWLAILTGILGLMICHCCGFLQFAFVSDNSILQAFLLASLPYLLKDVVSVAVAYGLAIPIRRTILLAEEGKTAESK